MVSVNDREYKFHSMPVHAPYFEPGNVCFRLDVFSVHYEVENPDVIAGIVPAPLVYEDNKVMTTVNLVKELKKGFPKEMTLWDEWSIQIPVTYKGDLGHYICGVYSRHIPTVVADREFFGIPRVPGHIVVDKNDREIKAKLLEYENKGEMIGLNCKLLMEPPAQQGPPPSAKKFVFKYIPSVTLGNPPDVKQLVELKYKKPYIQKAMRGEGSIELLEGAPGYLKKAGISKMSEFLYFDMEIDIIGGEVIHNYLEGGNR